MSVAMNSEERLGEIRLYPLFSGKYWRGTEEGEKKAQMITSVFCTDARVTFYIHLYKKLGFLV